MTGWALTMGRRRAVDRLRRQQSAVQRDRLAADRDYRPDHDSVLEQVEQNLEHQEVRRLLVKLTPRQRQSLELVFYQDRTYAQAAEQLGIPLGTFKSRVRDGLVRVRQHLDVRA